MKADKNTKGPAPTFSSSRSLAFFVRTVLFAPETVTRASASRQPSFASEVHLRTKGWNVSRTPRCKSTRVSSLIAGGGIQPVKPAPGMHL